MGSKAVFQPFIDPHEQNFISSRMVVALSVWSMIICEPRECRKGIQLTYYCYLFIYQVYFIPRRFSQQFTSSGRLCNDGGVLFARSCNSPTDVTMRKHIYVTHALVTSSLDHYNVFYVGQPLETSWKFEHMEKAAACMLMRASRYKHVTPILQKLHWLPIAFLAPFRVLGLIYKALNGVGTGYLKNCALPGNPS